MKQTKVFRLFSLVGLVIFSLAHHFPSLAQVSPATIPIACGDIIQQEFEADEHRTYSLELAAGDNMRLDLTQIGDVNDIRFWVYDRAENNLITFNTELNEQAGPYNAWIDGATQATLTVPVSGTYTIDVFDRNAVIGVFTLSVACTLANGTVIEPGESAPAADTSAPASGMVAAPSFSGVGFPGLAPVDFSNVARLPMIAGAAMSGAVTPTGGEILGFTLKAEAGDTLDLSFTRLSGNLNLGLVVLSAENQVVFQASLITSESLRTVLSLPSEGEYTIGVFRVDLLPLEQPEPTAFQVQGKLNP